MVIFERVWLAAKLASAERAAGSKARESGAPGAAARRASRVCSGMLGSATRTATAPADQMSARSEAGVGLEASGSPNGCATAVATRRAAPPPAEAFVRKPRMSRSARARSSGKASVQREAKAVTASSMRQAASAGLLARSSRAAAIASVRVSIVVVSMPRGRSRMGSMRAGIAGVVTAGACVSGLLRRALMMSAGVSTSTVVNTARTAKTIARVMAGVSVGVWRTGAAGGAGGA